MAAIEFGLMLQPFPKNFPGPELFNYNRRLIRTLSSGFTTLWAEDHLQLGETATHDDVSQNTFRFSLRKRFLDTFSVPAWLEGHFALV